DLAPSESIAVTVTFNVGLPGTDTLKLWATGEAGGETQFGYYLIPIQPAGAPTAALGNHNGDNRDRALCLTSGAGETGMWECGDLVVTHSMPGYATLGHERALTLLYNSAQAVPKPVVAATVNETGHGAPTAVFVRLTFNNHSDSATYNPWSSSPFTRQIVIAHDATTDSTGIYPFTLLVRNHYTAA